MSYIIPDVEADGPIPHKYSMVCFGAIIVEPSLSKTFYGKTKPISDLWIPESLAISGFTREEHLTFDDPKEVMQNFCDWIHENSVGQPILISDNLLFDGMFMSYYMNYFLGKNPFGWSGRRIGDLYCGMIKDSRGKWKHLRKTPHTHNPLDDSKGNAEALLAMQKMGLKIDLR